MTRIKKMKANRMRVDEVRYRIAPTCSWREATIFGSIIHYNHMMCITPMVYFVLDTVSSKIKIGVTSDLVSRIKAFMHANPNPIQLLGVRIFDNRRTAKEYETCLHNMFKEFTFRGEWFTSGDQLMSHIKTERLEYPISIGLAG